MNNALIQFLQSSILLGTPLLFGSVGEILTEKSGNLNLGIPGIMYVGGISGVVGGFLYQQAAGGKVNAAVSYTHLLSLSERTLTFFSSCATE